MPTMAAPVWGCPCFHFSQGIPHLLLLCLPQHTPRSKLLIAFNPANLEFFMRGIPMKQNGEMQRQGTNLETLNPSKNHTQPKYRWVSFSSFCLSVCLSFFSPPPLALSSKVVRMAEDAMDQCLKNSGQYEGRSRPGTMELWL